jgi:hypothetical protein
MAREDKGTWSKEEWDKYRRLSWASRRMVDIMCLFPSLSRKLAARELRKERADDTKDWEFQSEFKKFLEEDRRQSEEE